MDHFRLQNIYKQIIKRNQMTELINMAIHTTRISKMPNNQKLEQTRSSIFSSSTLQMTQSQQREKEFEMIIREQTLPYDMVIRACGNGFMIGVSLVLVEKNGNVVKVQDQRRKTCLIRKYVIEKKLYQPLIDPLSGVVAFRFGFFQFFSEFNKQSWSIKKEKIIKNLRLDKLFESIQKFHKLLNERQQFNFSGDIQDAKNYYLPLTKIISKVGRCDLSAFKSFIGKDNADQPKQHRNNKGNNNNKGQQLNKRSPKKYSFIEQLSHQLQCKSLSVISNIKPTQLQRQLKLINYQSMSILSKNRHGKSNFQSLVVNSKTKKCINQQLMIMQQKDILNSFMKINQGQLGKISISFDKQEEYIYFAKKQLLMMLPRNTEYNFLDSYFTNEIGVPISIMVLLEGQSLMAYLEANAMVMSMETKMRIFVQLCSGVQTLWEQNNIILSISNLRKIFITKNLTIKIRCLSDYMKIYMQLVLQEKQFVNAMLIKNSLNLTQIYFKLFFEHDICFGRSPNAENERISENKNYRGMSLMRKNIGTKLTHENRSLPHSMRDNMMGLSYIFWEFVNMAEKIEIDQIQRRCRMQIFKRLKKNNFKKKHLQQQSQQHETLLNFKPLCYWLLKNLQFIVQQTT